MNIKLIKEYKLQGERNNRPRQPLIIENKIYLIFVYDKKGFVESRIQCLSLDNFELIWDYTHDHVINNIIQSNDNNLLASCMNGIVLKFDSNNGNEIWRFTVDKSNIGNISNEYEDKIVFSNVQSSKGLTWSIDVKNGSIIWQQPNNGHSYIPIIYNNYVYNCIANNIYCLNLKDGTEVWKQSEEDTYLFNPKIFNEHIICSGNGIVNFYDLNSGKLVNHLKTEGKGVIKNIIKEEKNIYFGDSEGYFYCYSINNSEIILNWKVKTNGAIESIPEIINEYVFLINNDSKLIVVEKSNGVIVVEKKIKGEGGISGIVENNGKMYFSCKGGFLFEYEKK